MSRVRRTDEKLLRTIVRNVKGESAYEIVASLWDGGFLDMVVVEQLYILREVERRVRDGELKRVAMERVAEERSCSFEKVRAVIYSKQREKV